jgi:phosphopantothenoylcysteine decarboxylase/phosphopantothenate--cysteine ligase
MAEAVFSRRPRVDIIVMAAAVADYRPAPNPQKVKKQDFDGLLRLERTTDILAEAGRVKEPHQFLAGFAAETENIEENAKDKLLRKNADAIFANNVGNAGLGFGSDENEIIAFFRSGDHVERRELGAGAKSELGRRIAEAIAERLEERQ